jgi:hypothetical protein
MAVTSESSPRIFLIFEYNALADTDCSEMSSHSIPLSVSRNHEPYQGDTVLEPLRQAFLRLHGDLAHLSPCRVSSLKFLILFTFWLNASSWKAMLSQRP